VTPRAIDLVRQDCRDALQGREQLLGELKGAKLLVTGGTGFMGTWLAELVACLNDEHRFGTGLTLLARSTDRFSLEHPHLSGRPDVALVKADIRHVVEIPQDTRYVIHAAASPDNRAHASEPVETMELIANGTSAILRAVGRCSSFSRLLNLSSALVSGRQSPELPALPESSAEAPPPDPDQVVSLVKPAQEVPRHPFSVVPPTAITFGEAAGYSAPCPLSPAEAV